MNDNTDRYYEMPPEMPPLPSGTGRKASDAPVQEPAPTAGSKKKSVLLWVIPVGVVLVAGIAALCWYLLTPAQQTSVIEKEGSSSSKYYSALDPQKPQGETTQLSYGEWDGEIRLNQPHGQGRSPSPSNVSSASLTRKRGWRTRATTSSANTTPGSWYAAACTAPTDTPRTLSSPRSSNHTHTTV